MLRSLLIRAQGSFTQHLRKKKGEIKVSVIQEGYVYATLAQAKAFGVYPRKRIYIRKVILTCQHKPVLSAETVILQAIPPFHPVRQLKERPLGDFLFKQHRLRREWIQLTPDSRSSCFYLGHLKLYLTENFLPDLN